MQGRTAVTGVTRAIKGAREVLDAPLPRSGGDTQDREAVHPVCSRSDLSDHAVNLDHLDHLDRTPSITSIHAPPAAAMTLTEDGGVTRFALSGHPVPGEGGDLDA